MSENEDILARLHAHRDALEAQLRELDTAIAVVSRTLSSPLPEPPPPSAKDQAAALHEDGAPFRRFVLGTPGKAGPNIPPDAFFRMSIADAARKYLAMVKKKQTIQQIADSLEQGGITHTSKRFYGTVLTTLRRQEKQVGDIVKVGRGIWGLAEWYPNRKRKTTTEPKSPDSAPEGS
jgi:hypothetical protein